MGDLWQALDAVDALVATRGQALKRYAYLMCGDDDTADDLVQEALTRVLARSAPRDPAELERYVRRVLVNLVVDGARRAARWRRIVPRLAADPRSRDAAPEVVDRLALGGALQRLPARQRACVVLHYYEDLPVAEVAALLGCGTGTVKSQLHDARKALARVWESGAAERTDAVGGTA
jgi:RNA polymerase sigma-70 factor (sigma-E family)